MKTLLPLLPLLLLLLLSSFASAAGTKLQTQDMGDQTIAWTAAQTFSATNPHNGAENFNSSGNFVNGELFGFAFSSKSLSGTYTTGASGTVPCASTLTFVSNGHPAMVGLTGSVQVNTTGAALYLGYLLDGAYVNGQSSTVGVSPIGGPTNNADPRSVNFVDFITRQTPGNHTICIWFGNTGGGGNAITYPQANTTLTLWAKETGAQR